MRTFVVLVLQFLLHKCHTLRHLYHLLLLQLQERRRQMAGDMNDQDARERMPRKGNREDTGGDRRGKWRRKKNYGRRRWGKETSLLRTDMWGCAIGAWRPAADERAERCEA